MRRLMTFTAASPLFVRLAHPHSTSALRPAMPAALQTPRRLHRRSKSLSPLGLGLSRLRTESIRARPCCHPQRDARAAQ
ncbi:hypothetical protein M408DRAFT_292535 [Serendipita vermifera MAFF 305830]|uniref:Uncharacterized protein n=1 Tax=Serendipita vermifera MAFF 305830 TaxID=933852 RepID=A0A0C2WXZ3_SERVB|nr:hypothetical protein M408DRAFT_292535 [Serendipita vermifera MAFF 305830]